MSSAGVQAECIGILGALLCGIVVRLRQYSRCVKDARPVDCYSWASHYSL